MEMRRKARIAYQGKLRLQASGHREAVIARVQNLSPLGVFVTTTSADQLEVGSEVSCGFAFDKQARIVRGRVAWVRRVSKSAPLSSPGAGIEFLNLAPEDAALLHQLVDPGEQPRQAVDVWFEGMSNPIRCQAMVVGQDVRLVTELPFMRVGSLVKVAFTQDCGLLREGSLNVARFEQGDSGVPRLQLNVSMTQLDNARGTIEVKPALAAARHAKAAPVGGVPLGFDPLPASASPSPSTVPAQSPSPPPSPAPRATVTIDPAATAVTPPRWSPTLSGTTLPPTLAQPQRTFGRGWGAALLGALAGIAVVSAIFLALSQR